VRLPARIQSLLEREPELAQSDALLKECRSLTIVGTGGMGKTQCALAFAHLQAANFVDGAWYFDLANLESADEWLHALAFSLSIAQAERASLLARISQALVDRRALLVLDNCDRLSSELALLVVEVVRGASELKILATSQQQLNFIGERPLRMPAKLNELAAAPAVNLLLTRVREAHPIRADHRCCLNSAPADSKRRLRRPSGTARQYRQALRPREP
jgi:predicted ATPase